ncbi:UDP-N-acetylglucosamine 2-epimerase, partial [Pelagibacteraceae bacterium]|nr:UDP-N-acetylglucosamine 2-epimerase [Pelagibacteraceae bacterium]
MKKKILFVTGTRADYGKLKSLILKLQKRNSFKVHVFVTGMHNLKKFGSTWKALTYDKIKNIIRFKNQDNNDSMDYVLAKTIVGFKKTAAKLKPDLIVIHGDRIETLACAIVGSLNNYRTAHIEGGEVSGTVDEILRHSISKLAHIHFVTNLRAKKRLTQMGEFKNNIFIIGSPDVDIINSKKLPSLEEVIKSYGIKSKNYGIGILHPVTTNTKKLKMETMIFLNAIRRSEKNFILIYPNNDHGSNIILKQYKKINSYKFRILPSIRFEYYLTLLKNAKVIVGNSSSGIMEAPYYGVPTINIGDRQKNRSRLKTIQHCKFTEKKILSLINKMFLKTKRHKTKSEFGKGRSFEIFDKIL